MGIEMTEQWQELKETITELRDNDGTGTQQEVCKFLINYMEVLEKQMQEPVLDKIIADTGSALSEEVLDDNRQQISDVGIGLEIALRIIDKYKAKSGGKK